MRTIKYISTALFLLLIFSACERSIPFNKTKWDACEDETRCLYNDDRYKMALWLEKNYIFCGKDVHEIIDKFYKPKSDTWWIMNCLKKDRKLKMTLKQKDPNFIIGIDPWIDTDWIELTFDSINCVSKASIVNFNPDTKEWKERIICE